jgi:endonuclease/exonuclease/phosphatase (EEP) superfamily protein YafD
LELLLPQAGFADVVLLQETHLVHTLDQVDSSPGSRAMQRAYTLKYRLFSSAALGTAAGNSGGVAILVSVGMQSQLLAEVTPGRCIAVSLQSATLGHVILCSLYAHVSDVSLRTAQLETALRFLAQTGKPFILGGDFNQTVESTLPIAKGILPTFGL